MKNAAALLVSSPIPLGRKGVVAAISQFLIAHKGSVLHTDDHVDEGPIIERDVVRVSHRDTVEDMMRRGSDLEKVVLSSAVRWHPGVPEQDGGVHLTVPRTEASAQVIPGKA